MSNEEQIANVFLEPARVRVSRMPGVISTVVASSVAVCLWDRNKSFGGMCHYLYPEIREMGKTTVKYGNVAFFALVKIMKEFGSCIEDLDAQIFGGAEPLESEGAGLTYGPDNVAAAHRVIKKYGFRITSEDTGGHVGRKIAFNVETNEVVVYKVERMRQTDWHYK
ncbi:MAG: chemotaxis protein CheD [Proteobacteria bacterium]|nr:chemotaxis protein CheD [Pseudomonadota bacterium]